MIDSRNYDTSDFAVARDMIRPSIYSDDSKLLHAMVFKVLGRQHKYHHLNHPREYIMCFYVFYKKYGVCFIKEYGETQGRQTIDT